MNIEIAGELRNFRIEVNREIALLELCGGRWIVTNTATHEIMPSFECEDRIDAIMRVAKYLRSYTCNAASGRPITALKPSRPG